MIRYLLAFVLLSVLVHESTAQTADVIRTGRPGQSIGAFSVGQGLFQLQSGFNYNVVDFGRKQEFILNNNVLRYGITEPFEISAVLDLYDQLYDGDARTSENGGSRVQLGARYHLLDQQGIIPNLALQSRVLFLNAGELQFNTVSILSTSHKLSERFGFISNWKMVTYENGADPSFSYVFNLSHSLSERWGTFVEMYGGLNKFTTYFDTGISYLVNDDLQLDLYGGVQNTEGIEDYFIEAGLSWRWHN